MSTDRPPPGQALRRLLDEAAADGTVVRAPGCFDRISAALLVQSGARAAYLSGAIASAVTLGLPDRGFVGRAELGGLARDLAGSVFPMPLIADADTGYGNELQVHHTVTTYAAGGVAALHIEDQVEPKRCGHDAGKDVVPLDIATHRVAAAVRGAADSVDPSIVVIGRTDAASVLGVEAAIERAVAFAAVGAGLVFVEGVDDLDTLHRIHDAAGVGLVVNASEAGGPVDLPSPNDLASAGVRLVIHPVAAALASARAVAEVYRSLVLTGSADADAMVDWSTFNRVLGSDRLADLEEELGPTRPGD